MSGPLHSLESELLVERRSYKVVWAIGASIFLFFVWASLTELDKVTRAAGRVVPQQQNQLVQHFEGGIVTDILVKEGDRVSKGQPLVRIENSLWRSELQQARIDLEAKTLGRMRLEAEAKGLAEFEATPQQMKDHELQVTRERNLMRARAKTLNEQIAIFGDQIKQKLLEQQELDARWLHSVRERELAAQRLTNLEKLLGIGAISGNEILENQRVLQQIDTRLSDLSHEIPRVQAALDELRRRQSEVQLRFNSDVEKERTALQVEIAKLQEQISAMLDRNTRSAVLAPVDATINKLYVTTIGGVIRSGEPLVQLVPFEDKVLVEARLAPSDRADIWPGLPAVIKVSAYDYTRFGGLEGRVLDISPDALQDEKGVSYFRLRLEADTSKFGKSNPVVPGMTADVDIISGKRTIVAALLRPVRIMQERALRQ